MHEVLRGLRDSSCFRDDSGGGQDERVQGSEVAEECDGVRLLRRAFEARRVECTPAPETLDAEQ